MAGLSSVWTGQYDGGPVAGEVPAHLSGTAEVPLSKTLCPKSSGHSSSSIFFCTTLLYIIIYHAVLLLYIILYSTILCFAALIYTILY